MTTDADEPISTEEWLALHLLRAGKEPSKALPAPKYHDPATKGARMYIKQAESKLKAWWVYTRLRDRVGDYPAVSPMFREFVSSWARDENSTSDLADSITHSVEMEHICLIIDGDPERPEYPGIADIHKAAIVGQMRKFEVNANVWRYPGDYSVALDVVARLLREAEII